ncbi:MAG: hypothetical protein ABSB09_08990 [Acidimicrobiales bacterium]|jgi:hypothetical protein
MKAVAWGFDVTLTDPSITGRAMRDLVAMIGTATTTTRRAVRCPKHAFAPRAKFRPGNGVTANVTLPAQGHFRCSHRGRLASETSVAGDNPVNDVDPTGLAWYDIFNPWSPNNPIRENAQNGGLPSKLIQTFDPAYLAISGYMNEAEAAENGCSGWTEAEYGAEGVLGVAGTELFGLGGAGAVGGLFGGAADEGADSITGFTQHGLEQALGRDGGVGVSDSAMADAVTNPEEVIPQSDGAVKYVGKNAVVVLNSDGKVITTWATGSAGTR